VKRKPARKPANRRRAAEVLAVPAGDGWIQPTLFPVVLRRQCEVRAEQDGEVVAGRIPGVVRKLLERRTREILDDVKRWKMDHHTEPHVYSRGPGKKHFYTAEESVLRDLAEQIAAAAFKVVSDRYLPEISALVALLERQTRLLEQRRDNGQILAEEGRAARKPATDKRADRICRLYSRIRPQHPAGGRGNGAALAAVATQFGPLPRCDKPITTKAIRLILKRRGVPCR